VHVVSLVHQEEEAAHASDLEGIAASVAVAQVGRLRNLVAGVRALPTRRPLTHAMLDAPGLNPAIRRIMATRRPDVVLAYCSGMARFALEPPLRGLPFVLDMVDVDSAKWAALAERTPWPRSWVYVRESRMLNAFEAFAAQRAFASVVVTEAEFSVLRRIAPTARLEVVPNGVDTAALRPLSEPVASSTVTFCGVMNYEPNEAAALWLARQVWPLVRSVRPDARLKILGAHPSRPVRALADPTSGIDVVGAVPDVRPHLWQSAAAVAPLLIARGVQNKVLEAVAAGLPCVVTPVVSQGLPGEVLPACNVAATPQDFAGQIVSILELSPVDRRTRAATADLSRLTWEHRLQGMRSIINAAAQSACSRCSMGAVSS
jgi:sugar transferase (PEP-CTERM/EpsH1 system associated)